ncbi:MAG: Gfo/Idh/MocA family oxidoreductase [Rhodobacteraceae bacterium]|nr:Gfo/Idh/MocA family oxidoreductase [Paracoccaceae bacterium]
MIRVLIVGVGNMGLSHALAHHHHPDAKIVGIVNRSSRHLPDTLASYPSYTSFEAGMSTEPDLVIVATYPRSHAELAIQAMQAGAHVFVEKPLAMTLEDAKKVVAKSRETGRKLVVGYILRHHPSWVRFVQEARALGGPYVFRMNLNQQSTGAEWQVHKALMQDVSPLVDCGVHYVDVMCQITDARPIRVQGMGLRLSDEIPKNMYNYGQLQVIFDDGSVGWYEAGWGPMMSETAFFVKDVVSPNGSVSIVDSKLANSADIDGHTRVGNILVHRLAGNQTIELQAEPGHQGLCDTEQDYMLRTISENIDLSKHLSDALSSLQICLAADESIRQGISVELPLSGRV